LIDRRFPPQLRGAFGVEDVLQKAFRQAWQHIGGFRPRGPDAFYSWLVQIAQRELKSLIKAEKAAKRDFPRRAAGGPRQGSRSSVADLIELVAIHQKTPSRSAARREVAEALKRALDGLPDSYREVLDLRYFAGLSVAEVAAKTGRTRGAVMQCCQRALAKL